MKESRRKFQRAADDLDASLYRNAQMSRGRGDETVESSNCLVQTRLGFMQTSLEHVLKVNSCECGKLN